MTPPKNICTCEGAASIGYDDSKFTYSLDNRCRGIYLPIEFAIKVRKLQSTLSSALIRSRSREWASALATVSIKATNPPASWISFEPRTSTARLQRLCMTCKAWQRCWDSLQLGDYGNSSNLCTSCSFFSSSPFFSLHPSRVMFLEESPLAKRFVNQSASLLRNARGHRRGFPAEKS